MSAAYLAKLAARPLPAFVTARPELRALRRLAELGHVEARIYPPDASRAQFAEVMALTSSGRAALGAHASPGHDEPG